MVKKNTGIFQQVPVWMQQDYRVFIPHAGMRQYMSVFDDKHLH